MYSANCITIDKTDKAEKIITGVHGSTWKNQPTSTSYSTPMKSDTAYAESLAQANPLNYIGLKETTIKFGSEYLSYFCSCMQLAVWT
jgi:hypothetical protein